MGAQIIFWFICLRHTHTHKRVKRRMKGETCVQIQLWRKGSLLYAGVRGILAGMLAEHEGHACGSSMTKTTLLTTCLWDSALLSLSSSPLSHDQSFDNLILPHHDPRRAAIPSAWKIWAHYPQPFQLQLYVSFQALCGDCVQP